MVSTYSPNIQLEEPARGDQVGTWDTPVNNNMTLIDLVVGGRTTIALNNSPVVLASAQFQCKTITFNSTLTGSVAITFPTSFTKSYEIYHTCTGSSAFVITLQTTASGGQVVCCPPGEIVEVLNDGTNIRFKNFERVGTYWDYAGSSVPAWVSGCTVPPYLNCDGTSFSSATYPYLSTILGGTTLPDSKGRYRATINQGSGRITSSIGGVDGNTALAAGSTQTASLVTANLPPYTPAGTIVNTLGGAFTKGIFIGGATPPLTLIGGTASGGQVGDISVSGAFGGTPQGGTSTPFGILPPTYMGGITMIRAG